MVHRKTYVLAYASSALAMVVPLPAAAQAQAEAEAAASDERLPDEVANEIVVSGIRAALQSAEARKRNSAVVIDGITADDIGLLPDVSISESLTRIAGVTANDTARGSDQVAIRGLGPDLASTEFNGRILPTADGVNRRVGLGGLPSEGLRGAFVQKTPSGSAIEGGVSGILSLESIRPLESRRKGLTMVVRGLYEEGGDDFSEAQATRPFGARGELTYVGDLTENLGVALTYAGILDSNVQSGVQLENWRFDSTTRPLAGSPAGRTQVGARFDVNGDGAPDALPSTAGSIAQMVNTERHSVLGMLQWQASPAVLVSVDGIFSEETRSGQVRRFFAFEPFNGNNGLVNAAAVDNDTVVQFDGLVSTYRGLINAEKATDHTYGGGINIAIDDGGPFTAKFDISYFQAGRDRFTPVVNFDIDANTALTTAAAQTASARARFQYDIRDRENVSLVFAPLTPDDFAIQLINTVKQDSLNQIWAGRADFGYDLDAGFLQSIEWGLRFDHRSHQQRVDNTQYTYGATGSAPSQSALANRPDLTSAMLELPSNPLVSQAERLGGITAANYPYYDFDTLFNLGTTWPTASISDQFGIDIGARNDIKEDTYALYAQVNFGQSRLTGNLNARWFLTDTQVVGRIGGNPAEVRDVSVSNTYSFFLPSLNMRWEPVDDLLIRFGAARTISRPLYEELRIGANADLSGAGTGVINVNTGNPNLEPFTADGIDLGIEWYPDTGTSLAVAGYYKWISNFTTAATNAEFLTAPDGTQIPANVTRVFNDPNQRYFRGFEAQLRKDFDFLPGILGNFGVQANYNYNETDAFETFTSLAGPASFNINTTGTPAGIVMIPVSSTVEVLPINLATHVLNGILYYDTPKLNFRLAYRYYSEYSRRFANGYQLQPDGQLDFNFGISLNRRVRLIGTVTNILEADIIRLTEDSRDGGNQNLLQFFGNRGRDYALGLRVQF